MVSGSPISRIPHKYKSSCTKLLEYAEIPCFSFLHEIGRDDLIWPVAPRWTALVLVLMLLSLVPGPHGPSWALGSSGMEEPKQRDFVWSESNIVRPFDVHRDVGPPQEFGDTTTYYNILFSDTTLHGIDWEWLRMTGQFISLLLSNYSSRNSRV